MLKLITRAAAIFFCFYVCAHLWLADHPTGFALITVFVLIGLALSPEESQNEPKQLMTSAALLPAQQEALEIVQQR